MASDFDRVSRRIGDFAVRIAPRVRDSLTRAGGYWQAQMAKRFRYPLPPFLGPNTNEGLHNRTGSLRGGIRSTGVSGNTLSSFKLHLTSGPWVHARPQQFGAVIVPRNARHLWIPTPANMYPAGATRNPSVANWLAIHGPDGDGTAVVFKSKKGTWCIGQREAWRPGDVRVKASSIFSKKKESSPVTIMWIGKDRVVIPGPKTTGSASRLRFFETFYEDTLPLLRDELRQAARDVISKL